MSDALFQCLRAFRPDRCNSRSDHQPGDRTQFGKHDYIPDIIESQQYILDHGRMDFSPPT